MMLVVLLLIYRLMEYGITGNTRSERTIDNVLYGLHPCCREKRLAEKVNTTKKNHRKKRTHVTNIFKTLEFLLSRIVFLGNIWCVCAVDRVLL